MAMDVRKTLSVLLFAVALGDVCGFVHPFRCGTIRRLTRWNFDHLAVARTPIPETDEDKAATQDPTAATEEENEERKRREYEVFVGRAIDALRIDYPDILHSPPDYALYSRDLVAVEPSGIEMQGLTKYKGILACLHLAAGIFYDPAQSGMTFRVGFDDGWGGIRVSWHATLVPKSIFSDAPVHFDGISVYEIDTETGLISRHRIERLYMDSVSVRSPENGLFDAVASGSFVAHLEQVLGHISGTK